MIFRLSNEKIKIHKKKYIYIIRNLYKTFSRAVNFFDYLYFYIFLNKFETDKTSFHMF